MALILKVLSYKGDPVPDEPSCTFDQDGGSVGRSPDNRFVLPDPERFISRKHGLIAFRDGVYCFTDSSTAGTYLVNKDLLLQHDTAPLSNGDILKIGEYEIAVVEVPVPPLQPEEPPMDFDLFGNPPESPAWPEVPLWDLASDTPPPDSVIPQPVGPSFLDQPDVSPFHQSFVPPEITDKPEDPALPDFDLGALLHDLDAGEAAGGRKAVGSQSWELPDDFFQGLDLSELGSDRPGLADAQDPIPDSNPPDQPEDKPGSPWVENTLDDEPGPLVDGVISNRDTVPAASPELDPAPSSRDLGSPALSPVVPETVSAESQEVPPTPAESVPARELFAAFLAGAGLVSAKGGMKDEDMVAIMNSVGILLRNFVEGMMTVMRARAEMKSQFRVSVTTMRPIDNNPLKFTPNVDDALRIMLARNHPGFLDPIEAVREGFGDLMHHQMAMTAGIQASLAAALKRLDPQGFEKLYEDAIVFQRKAKCWEAYAKAYPTLVGEIMENFFGEEFGEVYERQMRILQSSQNR
ncbi:uncharacterized protein sS8_1198 [Methylocaldum marinum]|uniref:FHA domain-containing protein n=1 Tax=Methylocaldum marinum TaxID=1432792 RepID=A0A250KN81_9GAMM|nr:type VI secretion system-associated FHA domain protein TagH [Methylocaldum marinum]BBA33160.1 uncharacterized protein sS8_1198 [Methylocaldum marinum]